MADYRKVSALAQLELYEYGWLTDDVLIQKTCWDDVYEGAKESLIAGGHALTDWFPTTPCPGKRAGTIKRVFRVPGEHGAIVLRDLANGKWKVEISVSADEQAVRKMESEKRRDVIDKRREYEEALKDEEKELAHMPVSHEDYRAENVAYAERVLEMLVRWCGASKYDGYRYDQEALDEVERLSERIVATLETGRTLFSQSVHDARIAEVKAKTAALDPELRAFLDKVAKPS